MRRPTDDNINAGQAMKFSIDRYSSSIGIHRVKFPLGISVVEHGKHDVSLTAI
jgi:hypothetical protein